MTPQKTILLVDHRRASHVLVRRTTNRVAVGTNSDRAHTLGAADDKPCRQPSHVVWGRDQTGVCASP